MLSIAALVVAFIVPAEEGYVAARTLVLLDGSALVPDLRHTGAGLNLAAGHDRGFMMYGATLELRSADVGFGYCIEPCGLVGGPPARLARQLQVVPGVELDFRIVELGPLALTAGGRLGVALSTSTTDPIAIGFDSALQVGVRAALPAGFRVESHARWGAGNHMVPGAPTNALTSAWVVDAGLAWTFGLEQP